MSMMRVVELEEVIQGGRRVIKCWDWKLAEMTIIEEGVIERVIVSFREREGESAFVVWVVVLICRYSVDAKDYHHSAESRRPPSSFAEIDRALGSDYSRHGCQPSLVQAMKIFLLLLVEQQACRRPCFQLPSSINPLTHSCRDQLKISLLPNQMIWILSFL